MISFYSKETRLINAVKNGDLNAAKAEIGKGADVNGTDKEVSILILLD